MNKFNLTAVLLILILFLTMSNFAKADYWNGKWSRDNNNFITITNETKKSFHIIVITNNVKDVEGDATISGGVATLKRAKMSPVKFQMSIDSSSIVATFISEEGKTIICKYGISYETFFQRLNKDTPPPTAATLDNKSSYESKPQQQQEQVHSITTTSTTKWSGEWAINRDYHLIISAETNTAFHFRFDCYNGANVGQAEGEAKITGNTALYQQEGNCPIKFLNRGSLIGVSVIQNKNTDCFIDAGNGISYDGDYKSLANKSAIKKDAKESVTSFESFWKDFQNAVTKGDKNKVAEMVNFPFKEPIEGGIINKEQFFSNYSKYFDKKVVDKIKKSTIKDIREDKYYASSEAKPENSYYLQLNFGAGTEDAYTWTFIFVLRDGKYRLMEIGFAG